MNQTLVRIMIGTNNLDLLYTRNRFSKRLVDIPEDTNEVLLWRQVKRSGAKALHIFKNSNNNNQKKAQKNRKLRANKQSCYQDSSKSIEYITQLVQNLEAKLSKLGLKAPNCF